MEVPAIFPDSEAHRVSTALVRALVEIAEARGVSAEALLREDAHALYVEPAERLLPRSQFQALLARALQLSGDPALCLQFGFRASECSFGLMAPLVAYASTLRRALELVIQFQPLVFEGVQLRLSERLGVARLRCELQGDAAGDRGLVELMIAGFVRTLLAFGCKPSEQHAICFEHARPAHAQAYSRMFSGLERFSQAYNGIEFEACALDRAHLHRQSELHLLLLAEAERRLQRHWRPMSWTERVRGHLSHRSPAELPSMSEVARELSLSVRSLRRYLEDESTSYRALTQALLREAACSMLRNPAVTLHAIAHTLGFSNPTAFHRAFRRWVKLTPAAYRARFLEAGSNRPRMTPTLHEA